MENGSEYRTLLKAFGIRFDVLVYGNVSPGIQRMRGLGEVSHAYVWTLKRLLGRWPSTGQLAISPVSSLYYAVGNCLTLHKPFRLHGLSQEPKLNVSPHHSRLVPLSSGLALYPHRLASSISFLPSSAQWPPSPLWEW